MRPQMNLLGEEGNIFAILGRATRLLKENDMIEEVKEMTRRVFASHNYYKALNIVSEYVETELSDPSTSREVVQRIVSRQGEKPIPIQFHRKLNCKEELLMASQDDEQARYKIERIIEVTKTEYQRLSNDFFLPRPYIADHWDDMWFDDEEECWHCIMIRTPNAKEALLVESEGFGYARYTAFVQDQTQLKLEGIPIEQYREKTRSKER